MSVEPCFICGRPSVGTLTTTLHFESWEARPERQLILRYCDNHSRAEINRAAEQRLDVKGGHVQRRTRIV